MNELMTTSEVAQMLHIHINTARRWANKGVLKSVRIGPRQDRRFRRVDIEALLKSPGTDASQGEYGA